MEECQKTLQCLGLCPSASLVVSKLSREAGGGEGGQGAAPKVGMSPTQRSEIKEELQEVLARGLDQHGVPSGMGSGPVPIGRMRTGRNIPAGRGHVLRRADDESDNKPLSQPSASQQVAVDMEEDDQVAMDMEGTEQLSDRAKQGHVLGRQGPSAGGGHDGEEPMEVVNQRDDAQADSDSDSDSDPDPRMQPRPFYNFPPPPPHMGLPPGFGRPPGRRRRGQRRRVQFGPPAPPMFFGGGDDEVFGGEGHKLGGKEPVLAFGDAQRLKEKRQEAGGSFSLARQLKQEHVAGLWVLWLKCLFVIIISFP